MDYISSNFPISGLPIQQFCMSRISQFLVHIFSSFACPGVKKKNFSGKNSSLKDSSSQWGKFFPRCSVQAESLQKQSIWGKKISPVDLESQSLEIHWGNFFFPDAFFFQALGLNRASGEKFSPLGTRVFKTRVLTRIFFFFTLDMQNC